MPEARIGYIRSSESHGNHRFVWALIIHGNSATEFYDRGHCLLRSLSCRTTQDNYGKRQGEYVDQRYKSVHKISPSQNGEAVKLTDEEHARGLASSPRLQFESLAEHHSYSSFSGTFSNSSSSTLSTSMPSAWASKFTITRCRMAGRQTRLTSSKLTL